MRPTLASIALASIALLGTACGASPERVATLEDALDQTRGELQTVRGELDVERQRTDALAQRVVELEVATEQPAPAATESSPAIEGFWASELVGGSGGRSFDIVCPDGVATALSGKAGAVIDSLALVCRPTSSGRLGDPTSAGRAGGAGGSSFAAACPDDHAIIGLHGAAGAVIDSAIAICAPLVATETGWTVDLDAERTSLPGAGGKGGKAFELQCPDGQVVAGLTGRSGAVVDAVGLFCTAPQR